MQEYLGPWILTFFCDLQIFESDLKQLCLKHCDIVGWWLLQDSWQRMRNQFVARVVIRVPPCLEHMLQLNLLPVFFIQRMALVKALSSFH